MFAGTGARAPSISSVLLLCELSEFQGTGNSAESHVGNPLAHHTH